MAYIPYSPEVGCKYWLTGPDGTVAVFNDDTDPNYVGMLTDVTGLDSATVRESGDDSVGQDGGWHGNFWYGRRPITMSGQTFGYTDPAGRTARLDLLRRASNALRGDAILSWQPNAAGSVKMQTSVRRQQPLRISGNWVKDFQLSLVSKYAPLFSDTEHISTEEQNLWPNPGFELGSFGTISGATMAVDTAQHWEGSHSLKVTTTTGGVSYQSGYSAYPFDGYASAGVNYRIAARFRANTTTRGWRITVTWYNDSGASTGTSTGPDLGAPSGTWTTNSFNVTAPPGTVAYLLSVSTTSIPATGEIHWIDGIEVVQADAYSSYDAGVAARTLSFENQGDTVYYPEYVLWQPYGTSTNPTVVNLTTGDTLTTTGATLTGQQVLVVDTAVHTAQLFTPGSGWSNVANWLNWGTTNWPTLVPGVNVLQVGGTSTGQAPRVRVRWRDAWA